MAGNSCPGTLIPVPRNCDDPGLEQGEWRLVVRSKYRNIRVTGSYPQNYDSQYTWRLPCTSFLASVFESEIRKQVITKKKLQRSLQVSTPTTTSTWVLGGPLPPDVTPRFIGELQSPSMSPWVDPKSKYTLGFHNLHPKSTRAQNCGVYFLDPPGGLGMQCRFAELLRQVVRILQI